MLDLVLNRAATPLMEQAKAEGGTVANGQAAFLRASSETVRLLTGSAPGAETLRSALATELGIPEEALAVVGD